MITGQEFLRHREPNIPAVMASYFAEALLLPALLIALSIAIF